MPSLTIPAQYGPAMIAIRNLSPEAADELIKALAEAPVGRKTLLARSAAESRDRLMQLRSKKSSRLYYPLVWCYTIPMLI
jgi:hypothetical protein